MDILNPYLRQFLTTPTHYMNQYNIKTTYSFSLPHNSKTFFAFLHLKVIMCTRKKFFVLNVLKMNENDGVHFESKGNGIKTLKTEFIFEK